MRTIVRLMLGVQVGIFLVTAWTVMMKRAPDEKARRPVWSSLAISLVIVAGASWNIGERHLAEPGGDVLMYGSPLLLGLGLMALFMVIRQRRGLDRPS